MCGWCCGGVPVDKRGEGHKGCSPECHNVAAKPSKTEERRLRAEVARLARVVGTLSVALAEVAYEVDFLESDAGAVHPQRDAIVERIGNLSRTALAGDRGTEAPFSPKVTISDPVYVPAPGVRVCPVCGANNGEHGVVNGEACPVLTRKAADRGTEGSDQ